MSDTAVLQKVEALTKTVERLQERPGAAHPVGTGQGRTGSRLMFVNAAWDA